MSKAHNPPAFPRVLSQEDGDYGRKEFRCEHGMTLRDWFAGQAMQARLTHAEPCFEESWASTAEWAYEMADAMLAEREK